MKPERSKPFATPTPKKLGDGKGNQHKKATMTLPGKEKSKAQAGKKKSGAKKG